MSGNNGSGNDYRPEARKSRGELTRAAPVNAARKRKMILDLRAAGLTYEQIAEQLKAQGIRTTATGAGRIVTRALNELAREAGESVEQIRQLDLQRIDVALQVLYPKVREGNLKAMREWRAFIDQRSRLLGTYAPQRVEVKGQIEGALSDDERAEIRRLEEAFKASAPEVVDAEVVEDHLLPSAPPAGREAA